MVPSVTITQTEYENLLHATQEYFNLRQALLSGGVDSETLEVCNLGRMLLSQCRLTASRLSQGSQSLTAKIPRNHLAVIGFHHVRPISLVILPSQHLQTMANIPFPKSIIAC